MEPYTLEVRSCMAFGAMELALDPRPSIHPMEECRKLLMVLGTTKLYARIMFAQV